MPTLSVPIPQDFALSMDGVAGLDSGALLAALDTPPSVSIRLNRRKALPAMATSLYEDGCERVEWCADGRYLSERPVFTLNPLLHGGGFYVQDASSMIYQQIMERICDLISAGHGRPVPVSLLDFCAAPGGKTTAMINAVPDGSVVTANEYVPSRGKILRENLEKWGYPYVLTTGSSSSDYATLPEIFDIIAIDAPCSGEGMMRKDGEARRQWSGKLVAECAALQREILRDVAVTLRPGGWLIYSTCTFNTAEDEENARFIHDELGLKPVSAARLGLAGIEAVSPALADDVEGLRFMQHLTRGEGLFVSVFRREGSLEPMLESCEADFTAVARGGKPGRKSRGKGGRSNGVADITVSEESLMRLQSLMKPELAMQPVCRAEMVSMYPAQCLPVLRSLERAGIRITGAGLPAGEIKRGEVVADSRIVLSGACRDDAFPSVELSEQDALRYLRREAFPLPEGTPPGMVKVCRLGLPLGLMKNLGPRANNLFPSAWRIKI